MNDSTTPPDIERMLKVSFGSPPRPNPAHHRGLCVCRYRDTFLWAAIRGGSLQSECSGSEKDSTLSSPLHSNCYRANEKSLIWNCLQHHFHLARSHQYEHESSSLFRLSLDKDPAKPRFSTPPNYEEDGDHFSLLNHVIWEGETATTHHHPLWTSIEHEVSPSSLSLAEGLCMKSFGFAIVIRFAIDCK